MITIKNEDEIAAMREGGRMLATVLQVMKQEVRAGLTPEGYVGIAKRELQEAGR